MRGKEIHKKKNRFNKGAITAVFLLFLAAGLSGQKNNDYQYALIEAVKQKNLGNIQGAIELYKIVLDADDSVAVAYYELGTLYVATREIAEAESNLEKAVALDPGNTWYVNAFADVLAFQEKYKQAIGELEDLMKLNGREPEYEFKIANIYFVAEKYRRSLRLLRRMEEKYGVSDKILMLKANIYEKTGKLEKAVREIERILEYIPESVEFRVVAAELSMQAGNREQASEFYRQALELDSTNIFAITNLTDYYQGKNDFKNSLFYLNKSFRSEQIEYDRKMAILGYYLMDDYFINNYPDELEEMIRTVLKVHPDEKDIRIFATDFFIQRNNYRDAFDALEPLLMKGKPDYTIWKQGILLANAVNEDSALYRITGRALEAFPDSSEMIYFRGVAAYERAEYEEVITVFDRISILKEEKEIYNEAIVLKAEAYNKLGKYRESDSLFLKALELDPDNYLVLNNFSYYLALRGEDLEEARMMSHKAIQENPENGTFLDTYAWVLFKMGEYEEAEKYINKAIQKGGQNDPDIMEHAGDIHRALESMDMARSFYEKAIILGGDRELLESKISELMDHAE